MIINLKKKKTFNICIEINCTESKKIVENVDDLKTGE